MDIKMLAAQAALRKMVESEYFSICTMDNIIKMNNLKPDKEAYDILDTLHCVHYNQMPQELMAQLPELIARVLRSPSFDAPVPDPWRPGFVW